MIRARPPSAPLRLAVRYHHSLRNADARRDLEREAAFPVAAARSPERKPPKTSACAGTEAKRRAREAPYLSLAKIFGSSAGALRARRAMGAITGTKGGEERGAKHLRRLRGEGMHRQASAENRHIDDRHEGPSHEEPKRLPWSH